MTTAECKALESVGMTLESVPKKDTPFIDIPIQTPIKLEGAGEEK